MNISKVIFNNKNRKKSTIEIRKNKKLYVLTVESNRLYAFK